MFSRKIKYLLGVSMIAISAISYPVELQAAPQSGRVAWFGHYGHGRYSDGKAKHRWYDSGAGGPPALRGAKWTEPGIALRNRKTLGHWFDVELRGKIHRVRQTDIGPASWTRRVIDINAALADQAGFSPNNFPTDSIVKFRHIGPKNVIAEPLVEPISPPIVERVEPKKVERPRPKIVKVEPPAPEIIPPFPSFFPFNLFLPPSAENPGIPPFYGFEYLEPTLPQEVEEEEVPPASVQPRIVGRYPGGLHPVIKESMLEASKYLPPGYKLRFNNAARRSSTVGSHSYHLRRDRLGALAVDIELIDPRGKPLRNLRAPDNFAIYRDFMQHTKKVQYDRFPAYRGRGRWGGYFVFGVSQDLMHYDLGPERGTMAGDWSRGLKSRYAYFGRKGDVGKGMGEIGKFQLPPIYAGKKLKNLFGRLF